MRVLLIPSAILISKDMRKKFGDIPAALYPLNEIPIIDHLYKQYENIVDKIVLVSYKKSDLLVDYVITKKMNIDILKLDKLEDLGYTIWYGLKKILSYNNVEGVYINFADTLVFENLNKLEKDTCFCNEKELNNVWTFFSRNEKNQINEIYDKTSTIDESLKKMQMFVGLFYIKKYERFYSVLDQYQNNKENKESFYLALKDYSKEEKINFVMTNNWFDVGHNENYLHAKTGVKARSFNSIEIDELRGILRKTSINKNKFINEIKWYLKLPDRLQYLIPRIYHYSISYDNPFVEMECYGYNTLHELFLYGQVPLYKWQKIFERLKFIIMDMEKYIVKDPDSIKNAMYDIYVKKTINRLKELEDMNEFKSFFTNDIVINKVKYHSLCYYMNILPELIEERLLKKEATHFNIIHGDLCFSNILIEETHGFVRIIDPRGEFGKFDIYGDVRYEMAKLLHSIEGKYDFIIEDMFDISVVGNTITYTMQEKTDKILNVFKSVFEDHLGNYNEIKLIESTLFLSMIPLHSDYRNRQFAMLATGIMLLEEVLGE